MYTYRFTLYYACATSSCGCTVLYCTAFPIIRYEMSHAYQGRPAAGGGQRDWPHDARHVAHTKVSDRQAHGAPIQHN